MVIGDKADSPFSKWATPELLENDFTVKLPLTLKRLVQCLKVALVIWIVALVRLIL